VQAYWKLGRRNENVVALCADLVGSLKMQDFIKEFPEKFTQTGIAEANIICMAAGMTIGGKIQFTGSKSGKPADLMKKYGLDADHIVKAVLKVISREKETVEAAGV